MELLHQCTIFGRPRTYSRRRIYSDFYCLTPQMQHSLSVLVALASTDSLGIFSVQLLIPQFRRVLNASKLPSRLLAVIMLHRVLCLVLLLPSVPLGYMALDKTPFAMCLIRYSCKDPPAAFKDPCPVQSNKDRMVHLPHGLDRAPLFLLFRTIHANGYCSRTYK
ncbi:hypothetical protein BDW71DRAFT_188846 [Aspergillus fruticulosus]